MNFSSPDTWKRYLKSGLQAISDTFQRFPITLLLFFGIAAIIIYRIEVPYQQLKDISDILDRLTGVMAMGIPLSLSISLILEKLEKDKKIALKIGASIAIAAVLYLYYLFLFTGTEMVPMTRLLLITGAMILAFLFIPYLKKRSHFEVYVINVISRAATTAFYTVVLGLGLMAILFAIKSLLISGMDSEIYLETWVLAWLVFAPLHFLYSLPYIKDDFTTEDFNKVFKIMLLYIVLPVITAYTIVLYLYFGKIIITQVWPKGIVSYLVVSYTAASIAAIFFISPFREQNKWVRIFTASLTKLIFPLLGMMFISIGIRIGEFGFTENRYFILAIGLWSTAIMIYLNFNKKNTLVLPITLAIFALLSVFGPWSAFEVSKMSQSNRFYQIASKYDMIKDGKVEKGSYTVDTYDQQEISGVLRYFERSHELSDLKYLPDNFTMNQMKNVFGFSEIYPTGMPNNYFGYHLERGLPVEITGYDVYFRLEAFRYNPDSQNIFEREINTQKGNVKLVLDNNNQLIIQNNTMEIYRYDLRKYVQSLYDNYGSDMSVNKKPGTTDSPDQEKLIFTDDTAKVKIKMIFYNINGSVDEGNDGLKIDHIDGEIFLGIE